MAYLVPRHRSAEAVMRENRDCGSTWLGNEANANRTAQYQSHILYHAIENTANQNTGKPLYIRRYSTQPSHRALQSYSRRNLVSVFSMAWYKIVTQHFLVVYIEDITRWREDMNFMFEWQKRYLTSERSERVRCRFCHENIKFISLS